LKISQVIAIRDGRTNTDSVFIKANEDKTNPETPATVVAQQLDLMPDDTVRQTIQMYKPVIVARDVWDVKDIESVADDQEYLRHVLTDEEYDWEGAEAQRERALELLEDNG